jgi:predicted TPR repeat methyltransferase
MINQVPHWHIHHGTGTAERQLELLGRAGPHITAPSSNTPSAQDYQHSASFVPKLAGKVVQWLDLGKDDVLLDIGCGGQLQGLGVTIVANVVDQTGF